MEIADSIEARIDEIRNDNSSGAHELAFKAINTIENQIDLIEDNKKDIKDLIYKLSYRLINSRPSMAPLINSVGYILSSTDNFTKESITRVLRSYYKYQAIKKDTLEQYFNKFLSNTAISEPTIMLISYSSTIQNLISRHNDIPFTFYILESRPLLEGQKVAKELSKRFETHLIVDAAMGKFITEIDMVLIGIDSILKDGAIINKIGTYPLSVLAKSNGKPVYAIGDSFKYNLRSHFNLDIKIAEKPKNEVFEGVNPNFYVENYYFDITPPQYIHGIISDLGRLSVPDFIKRIEDELPISWFKKFINI